jgi:hypothetical protein
MRTKIKPHGYYIELAENGPWLTFDGEVTLDFEERGIWPSKPKAQAAIRDALDMVRGEDGK